MQLFINMMIATIVNNPSPYQVTLKMVSKTINVIILYFGG